MGTKLSVKTPASNLSPDFGLGGKCQRCQREESDYERGVSALIRRGLQCIEKNDPELYRRLITVKMLDLMTLQAKLQPDDTIIDLDTRLNVTRNREHKEKAEHYRTLDKTVRSTFQPAGCPQRSVDMGEVMTRVEMLARAAGTRQFIQPPLNQESRPAESQGSRPKKPARRSLRRGRPVGVCWNCNQPGHLYYTCPLPLIPSLASRMTMN